MRGLGFRVPYGGVRPFHQKSTCLAQLTLGPNVVQIWLRNTLKFGGNETLKLHRVGGGASGFSPPSLSLARAQAFSPSYNALSRPPALPLSHTHTPTDPHPHPHTHPPTPTPKPTLIRTHTHSLSLSNTHCLARALTATTTPHAPRLPHALSSDDVFQDTSARYRVEEPEQWLQRHPEAGSS